MAEIFHVIETDRRDYAQNRRHHIGRIEPPAEPRLDHRALDARLGEVQEHHRHRELEKRERQPRAVVNCAQPLDIIQHLRRRNFGAGDERPLRQVYQVRLGVESGAVAGGAEATVEHRGHRTFALGARDMNRAKPAMRIADQFERGVHAFELVDLAARLQRIQPVDSFRELVHFQPGVYRLPLDGGRFCPDRLMSSLNYLRAFVHTIDRATV